MSSQTLRKFPIIDLSVEDLKPGTNRWNSASNEVRRALEEYGYFVAEYNKFGFLDLQSSVFHKVKELFDLPTEIKMRNRSNEAGKGYIGEDSLIRPLYESMGIDNEATLEGIQRFANLMWPAGNDSFCQSLVSFSRTAAELDQLVKRMVFESYGVEKNYQSIVDSTTYSLRFNKYRAPKEKETNLGVMVHTDKSFITILHQNQVNGLEVKTKDGEWICIELSPSSYVVMAGDAFLAWSNGRVHSPKHRVIMSGNTTRYTLSLFSFCSEMLCVPEELVDDEHPLQFKPFDHYGLLRFYMAQDPAGSSEWISESTARAYCGV